MNPKIEEKTLSNAEALKAVCDAVTRLADGLHGLGNPSLSPSDAHSRARDAADQAKRELDKLRRRLPKD